MDNNTATVTAYAPQLGMLACILNGLTALQFQVRDEVAMALLTNEPINRTMPYTAGDLDELTWFVQAKPGHDYSQLEVGITCEDDTVQKMLKAALAADRVYLAAEDIVNNGDVLRCTIAGARVGRANEYTDKFGTLVW